MAWLLDSGKFQHQVFELHTLGAEDKKVVERDGALFLTSSHGTLINEKLTPNATSTELYHGDIIQIGKRKITVVYSRFFLPAPIALSLSGATALLLLFVVASGQELSLEFGGVLLTSVLLALGITGLFTSKRVWSAKVSSLNFILILLLSAALCEGMLRLASYAPPLASQRVPASLIESP